MKQRERFCRAFEAVRCDEKALLACLWTLGCCPKKRGRSLARFAIPTTCFVGQITVSDDLSDGQTLRVGIRTFRVISDGEDKIPFKKVRATYS